MHTHTRTHARTHARTHTHTHTSAQKQFQETRRVGPARAWFKTNYTVYRVTYRICGRFGGDFNLAILSYVALMNNALLGVK